MGADSEPLQVAVQPGEASSFNLSIYTNGADLALEAPDSQSDPNAPSDPLYWISNPATNLRDTNARPGSSGVQSLKLALEAGASYWSQSQIGVPPGVSGVFRFWAASDGGTSPSDVWAGFLTRNVHGTLSEQDAPSVPFTLPASSTAWAQLPLQAFHAVPGDSQFPRQGLEELRLHGSGASDQSVWFDDLELYMLSLAFSDDAAGRSAETVRPDGARTRLVWERFGRVVSAVDPQGRATSMKHDSLDRAVQVTDPLGNCVSSDSLLPLTYGYDLAGNRVSLVTGDDTFDYGLDDAGQMVEETINRFVERRKARFILGDARQVQVDAGGVVSLVPFSDSFAGDAIDADRWRIATSPALWRNGITDPGFVGLQVVQNDGLHVAFPRGNSDVNHAEDIPFRPDTYGLFNRDLWVAAEHRTPVSGDFDIQVDFAEFQGHPDDLEHAVGLWVGQTHYEEEQVVPSNSVLVGRTSDGQGYICQVYRTGTLQPVATVSLADAAGKFRISRSGSTVSMSYWDGTGWVGFSNSPFSDWSTSALWVALVSRTQSQALGSVVFRNLAGNEPTSGYPSTGSYTSTIYDAGRTVAWGNLSWGATTPGSSTLGLQVAVSATPDPLAWSFVGPDGTSSTWFTTSGTSIPDALCISYQPTFAGDGTVSPSLSDVEVSFSGANTSRVLLYSYDPSGDMTRKVTVTDGGTSTEVRDDETWSTTDRINNLDQLRRNNVTPAGGSTTTWRYTYDLSGNMTANTDGIDTWTCAWDEDNRLTQGTLPDQTMVEYTCDVMGRMLTRSHSVDGTTILEWDGWDCVRETAPGGTVTRWLAPQGELLAFERGASRTRSMPTRSRPSVW